MHRTAVVAAAYVVLGLAAAVPPGRKPCPPRASLAEVSEHHFGLRGGNKSIAAVAKPDPTCKTGLLTLPGLPKPGGPQVCCPSYCGECSDYPSCASVRGQNSKYSCCASDVLALAC